MMPRFYFLLLLPLLLIACKSSEETPNGHDIETQGVIQYIELEGGFYGIVTEDGERYNPLDLPESYRVDSLQVKFTAEVVEDVVTIQMWGTPVRILDISRQDD